MWNVVLTVLLSAMLDFIGLAMLLPVLYYLLEGGENQQAAFWFSLLAVGVVLFKTILVIFFTRYQNSYFMSFYKRLSFSLFSSYYKRGILFIREHGSSRLGYEVNGMCMAFGQRLLAPILRMMGDGLLILLVTIALLVYDGMTVLVLYVSFLPFMIIYYFGVRKRVKVYGEQDLLARRAHSRIVQDTFRGYAELEVNGAFPVLQESFLEGMELITRNRVKLDTILRFPLFLSELSVVVGLTALVAMGTGNVKVLVGVFAVAAFRLLPALRSILTGWTQIQNAICCLDVIEEGLKDYSSEEPEISQDLAFEQEIRIQGLAYTYPNGEQVYKNLNSCIRKGEYVGFQGYSGVGKSTLFNLLLGLLEPDKGEILIDGVPLTPERRRAWMNRIGYVPQEVFIFRGTLAENIALGEKEIDRERIRVLLGQVRLEQWLHQLPEGIDTELSESGSTLSGGQRQRIGIARALYKQPELLFLDEATSALDLRTEQEINETIGRLKQVFPDLTVLSIAHRDSSLVLCDRIIKIENKDE
jgi:ABC-type multidrug transport system fused ATPase/permease subunit